jgi:hypothetical protein
MRKHKAERYEGGYKNILQVLKEIGAPEDTETRIWMAATKYSELHEIADSRIDDAYDDMVEIMMHHLKIYNPHHNIWANNFEKAVREYPLEQFEDRTFIKALILNYELVFEKVQTLMLQETRYELK